VYGKETLGTEPVTVAPDENANKLMEIFEIVRRNLERASQAQARNCILRRRQWTPALGDVVCAKEHHLYKTGPELSRIPRKDITQGNFKDTLENTPRMSSRDTDQVYPTTVKIRVHKQVP